MKAEMKSLIEIYQKNREIKKLDYSLDFQNHQKKRFIGEELIILRQIIDEEYSSGKTYREIGELFNLNYSTIAFHRKKSLKH